VRHLGYSAETYGALVSLNGVLIVLFELPLTTVTRRFGPTRVIATGYAVAGVGLSLILLARSTVLLAGCIAVFTLGEMISMPVASAFVADLAPPAVRGRYMGVYGLTWTLGILVGPAVGMQLLSLGPPFLWLTCGVLGLFAGTTVLLGVRPRTP
jgi:MFS family permease